MVSDIKTFEVQVCPTVDAVTLSQAVEKLTPSFDSVSQELFDITAYGTQLVAHVKDANGDTLNAACYSLEFQVAPVHSSEWDMSLAYISLDDPVSP